MIGVTWTGWDGSVWDLRTGSVHLTDGGVEGLSMLDSDVFTRETALVDGQRFTGWRAKPRRVLLPVLIGQAATELEWLALDRAWWKTMRPDREGTLTVTAPDGSSRHIALRFDSDGGMAMSRDPSRHRLTVAPLAMIADDPWWKGEPVVNSFNNGTAPVNFFGGASGLATPFIIGSANTVDSAALTNEGDIPAYPIHYFAGPLSAFSVSIDSKPVAGTFALLDGQTLEVETAPSRQVAYLIQGETKTNVTRQLSSLEFTPIPAEETVHLDLLLTGTGSLIVAYTPRYFRAW